MVPNRSVDICIKLYAGDTVGAITAANEQFGTEPDRKATESLLAEYCDALQNMRDECKDGETRVIPPKADPRNRAAFLDTCRMYRPAFDRLPARHRAGQPALGHEPAGSALHPSTSAATQPPSGPRDEARALRDKLLRVMPPVIILKSAVTFAEYREVVRTAESIEGVVAAAPFVFMELLIASAGHPPIGVALKCIDPQRASSMRVPGRALKTGKLLDLAQGDPPAIILGDQLAALLGVRTGDRVVITHKPETQPAGKPPREYPFRVTGILHTDLDVYDSYLAFASLAAGQQIVDRGDEVMGVEVSVKDIDRSDEVARAIERALGEAPYQAMDWFELNRALFNGRRP